MVRRRTRSKVGASPTPVLVVVAAHLPPPVHGMAVAVEAFTHLLDDAAANAGGKVVRTDISSDPGQRRFGQHVDRCWRVAVALRQIWRHRQDSPAIYVSCDAGLGMIFTIFLTSLARLLRQRAYVHHHSYAYVRKRRRLFLGLAQASGKRTVHLAGCDKMAEELCGRYPELGEVRVLPILYAVPTVDQLPRRYNGGDVVLGHLSNLSEEKGLRDVFATAEELSRLGVNSRIALAGPPLRSKDAVLLQSLLSRAGNTVEYLGPVYGRAREKFYDGIDIFVFPSRYRHESFGLVAGEAFVRGIPIVAYEAGCLSQDLVGKESLVLKRTQPFPTTAARWIAHQVERGRTSGLQPDTERLHEAAKLRARELATEMVIGPQSNG